MIASSSRVRNRAEKLTNQLEIKRTSLPMELNFSAMRHKINALMIQKRNLGVRKHKFHVLLEGSLSTVAFKFFHVESISHDIGNQHAHSHLLKRTLDVLHMFVQHIRSRLNNAFNRNIIKVCNKLII